MTSTYLQQWMRHPERLDRDTLYELRTLVARYPYFQTLRLLYLKNLYLLHDVNFGAELRKAVLYVSDRRVLFYLIEGDRYALKPQHSFPASSGILDEEPSMDRTLSLIDAFLATVPEEQPKTIELDYAMDYTAYLLQEEEDGVSGTAAEEGIPAKEEEAPKLRGQELIDGFIRKSENEERRLLPSEPELPAAEPAQTDSGQAASFADDGLDDSCFTETLAKIYVKQRRYDKALEIIKKLSLNYPKKNAYFADQIRFLEKLIINAKSK